MAGVRIGCDELFEKITILWCIIAAMALDNENPRLTQSEYKVFDFAFAQKIKDDHPSIWKAGGNIRGNQAFQYLKRYKDGDRSDSVLRFLSEREAWCARHFNDGGQFKDDDKSPNLSNIGGIVAQMKWLCVGVLGETKMKEKMNQVIDKIESSNVAEINAKAEGIEVSLTGEVGSWKVSADQLIAAIGEKKKQPLTIKVNSVGGDVFEGFALYNAIKNHEGPTTAIVEGIAASAGSLLIMAADSIVLRSASMLMIHNPWMMGVAGESKDFRNAAETLDKIKQIMVERYSERTGNDAETLSRLLDEETWLTPQEAVDLGFADRIDKDESIEKVQNSIISQFKNMFKTKSQVVAALTAEEIKTIAASLEVADKMDLIKSLADNVEGVSEVCVKMDGEEKYMSSPEVAVIPMDDHSMLLALGSLEVREAEEAEEAEEVEAGYHDDEEKAMEEMEEKEAKSEEYTALMEAVSNLTEQINLMKEERAADVVAKSNNEIAKPMSWKQTVIANAKNQKK